MPAARYRTPPKGRARTPFEGRARTTDRTRGDVISLCWQTGKEDLRAQAVYERVGATRADWVDYSLSI